MPYLFDYPWERNPRLIKMTFIGDVSKEELVDALEEAARLMDRSTMPLHVILSFDKSQHLPDNMLDPIHNSRMLRHANQGYCVFMNPDKFLAFVAQVVSQDLGIPIEIAGDDDDAWDFFSELGLC